MSHVRIDLPANGAVLEITTPERVINLRGGEHITLDMSLPGDRITLVLRQHAEDIKRHKGE